MNLLSRAKYLNKEVLDARAKLKEVFQNEALRKDTRWEYFLAYSMIDTNINIGVPSGFYKLAREEGLEPWQDQYSPPGWVVTAEELVTLWKITGLNTVKLKDFFMETAITKMVITNE